MIIQIWTTLIAYRLLVWLKFKTNVIWGLLELTRLALFPWASVTLGSGLAGQK